MMSGAKKTVFDTDHSNAADLPNFIQKKHGAEKTSAPRVEEFDTYDNMDLVTGEKIKQDTHTLVRSGGKDKMDKHGKLRESMVGMKEGVPGIYSGFERTEKKHSNFESKGSKSDKNKEGTPVRPPRKGKAKSQSSIGDDDSSYDHLWTEKKIQRGDDEEHEYSLLGSGQMELYDDVKEGRDTSAVVMDSNTMNQWIEGDRKFDSADRLRKRPMSTVVLPLSQVEGSHDNEMDDELDNESDWGSDFEESLPNDRDEEEDLYEIVGDMSDRNATNRNSVYDDLTAVRAKTAQVLNDTVASKPLPPVPDKPLPPIPDDSLSLHEPDEEAVPYVDIIYEGDKIPLPMLPPLGDFASEDEVKRYQIIKYILENEKMYLTTVNNLLQDYEKPLKANRIINQESVKIIFQHLQEIEQCHKLFNIALVGRMAEWNANPIIGDIIYASFSKSMVLKAYTSYVKNFTGAMDRVKENCRTVPSFLLFLRNRLKKSFYKYSFYDLLKRPIGRFPQLVVLLQELLKVTPVCHPDRLPLQMALTHLECLSEVICDKRRDMEMKYKVSQLDKYFSGLNKPLFSSTRYYIRHDDMLLCKIVDGRVMKTKHRRLFLLSDLLICASIINKSSAANMLTNKRYRVKWCVPIVEVDVVDVGSGITVNIDNKTTTTITYTHPVSSPRPGAANVEQRLEDLQHDLAVIGQIAGLIASLRQGYDVINAEKVGEWYRNVKDTFDKEIETANLHWLELSIPAKDKKTTKCLFNLHPPQKKIEWTTELENAKLRLAFDNNPGWFILEDESANIGNMGILRRNLPLLANKVPLIMVDSKYAIDRVLEVIPSGSSKPILWIFSGSDHSGVITLMEMSMSSVPHVIESFVACESRILAAEVVVDQSNDFPADASQQKISVWCGTMSGRVFIFNASSDDHEEIASAQLRDSVLCFRHVQGKMFAGIANGTIAYFRRKVDNSWDCNNPVVVCLSKSAVMDMTEARGKLWCAAGSFIFVLNVETLGIERKIQVSSGSRVAVKHLVSYGSGVWASVWKSPMLHLYHNETFECLQSLSVVTPLTRMKNDIDTRIQAVNVDKVQVTSLLARGGLLWVGTDNGIIITYPLPRLGGVPQVSGKPCVSFHGHEGAVRCFHAFRVKRCLKHSADSVTGEDAIGRSLFYIDPFDQAASSLNLPRSYPELVPPESIESPIDTNEPFYYALEPEEGGPMTSSPQGSYEKWLKSFDGNINKVDPIFSPEEAELRNRHGSYNSDESMDSDTEFSFIEDRAKKIPAKIEKRAPSFSIDFRASETDGVPQATVTANGLPGNMDPITEIPFAELVSSFKGFDSGKGVVDGDAMEPSIDDTGFVMLGKTGSGYEEPIPPPDMIVTVPCTKVARSRNGKGNGTLKDQPSLVVEVNRSIPARDQTIDSKQPDDELCTKYKNEPLPEIPVKTLFEKSKEWTDAQGEYENLENIVPIDNEAGQDSKVTGETNLKLNTDAVNQEEAVSGESVVFSGAAEERTDKLANEADKIKDGRTKDEEAKEQSNLQQNEDEQKVEETSGADNGRAPTSVKDIPVLADHNVDEPELDFEGNDLEAGAFNERDVKSPIFIRVTDPETQESIEGALDMEHSPVMSRDSRFKSFSASTKSVVEPQRGRSETMPAKVTATESGVPWSSKGGRFKETDETDLPNANDNASPKNTPDQLDLSAAKTWEKSESVYTPLLNKSREPAVKIMPNAGTSAYEADMAISNTLAREKVARESQQGMYASLISVANRDGESRQDLLLQPLYVVSVGSGYMDLRRKQKIGSGLEFFMKFTASEPTPKLLIWKVTS